MSVKGNKPNANLRNSARKTKVTKETAKKQLNNPFEISDAVKNILSLFMVCVIPNVVMVLDHIVRKCDSSLIKFYNQFQEKKVLDLFRDIWLRDELDLKFGISFILGYSLFVLSLMILVPGKKVKGSQTPRGNTPVFKDNGFSCYIICIITFAGLAYYLPIWTSFSVSIIYKKFSSILACLSLCNIVFCLLLYIKGIYFPTCPDQKKTGYFFYDYFCGIEMHPTIKNINLKIFTNCRFGLTAWPLLILCYVQYAFENGAIHGGLLVNAVLQLLYLTKFFWWESGYYKTIDISTDRAGFYICWGCTTFVPSLYTLSSYHMASQSSVMSDTYYYGILIIGILSLIFNYWADYQKQVVRASNGNCLVWNKPVKLIRAKYRDLNGFEKENILIVSGFWGLARHFHYLPELLLSFCWCGSAGFSHFIPFTYFIFLVILLFHRVERDDLKCTSKYGKYYEEYKSIVKWKIIPYVY